MGYTSKCEIIMGILVIIFALWDTNFSSVVLVLLGIALIVHSFMCRACGCCCAEKCEMEEIKGKTKRKK